MSKMITLFLPGYVTYTSLEETSHLDIVAVIQLSSLTFIIMHMLLKQLPHTLYLTLKI